MKMAFPASREGEEQLNTYCCLEDAKFRQRHDEPGASLAELDALCEDFLREVPCEDQHIIRLAHRKLPCAHDGNVRPGHVQTNLQGIVLENALQGLEAEAAEIQQGACFRRCPISTDLFPYKTLQFQKEPCLRGVHA